MRLPLKLIILALFCCVFMTSCSPLQANVEELISPPLLSEKQYGVDLAMKDLVGENFKLKYPGSGNYRSPYIFFDIDGDNEDEAIVLYSLSDSSSTWITVLDSVDGRWVSGNSIANIGKNVEFVQFEQILGNKGKCLIVGSSMESSDDKYVAVYTFNEPALELVFAESYSQIAIDDLNSDSLCEILLISSSNASLIGELDGTVDIISEVTLNRFVSSYLTPLYSAFPDGSTGVVVDGYITSSMLCTTVIQVKDDELYLPFSDNVNLFTTTYRSQEVFSADINGDGIIEIPIQYMAPGHDRLDKDNVLYLTDYSVLDGDSFRLARKALVNSTDGYRFLFPESWDYSLGEVTAMRQSETGQITFFLYNGNVYDSSLEILRLRTYYIADYKDKLELQNFFLLAQRGMFEYYGLIPPAPPEGFHIDKDELLECFNFVN